MTSRRPLSPVTGLKRTSTLPPPPPRTARHAVPDPVTDTPQESSTTARGTAQSRRSAEDRWSAPRVSDTADTIRAISLSLPLPLVEALKDRARTERITHADVLMDAVTAQHRDLATLVKEAKPNTDNDALFIRRRRGNTPTYVALSLRMLSKNVSALDELTQHHHADSRSQLCAAALTGYLIPNS